MKNISIFQLVLLGIFGLLFAGGVIVAGVYSQNSEQKNSEKVSIVIWGSLDASSMNKVIKEADLGTMQVTYVQKPESVFDFGIAEAIVSGQGPDIMLLRHDSLVQNRNKITRFPYESYPARQFQDTFIQGARLFTTPGGIIGLPFVIDPLIMYWNRDLFLQQGLVNPPLFWDEIYALSGQLTKYNSSGSIIQSGVALGEFDNIKNAKSILSSMFLQNGMEISNWKNDFEVEISFRNNISLASDIVSFYSQFSDSRKVIHSWSRALTGSDILFISNRLAIYFGLGSEMVGFDTRSPNLNYDIALIPQPRNKFTSRTLGNMYGFVVLRNSRNREVGFEVIKALTEQKPVSMFVSATSFAPARIDIQASPTDPFQEVIFQSALISSAWLDPNRNASQFLFKDMINSVSSGFTTSSQAITDFEKQLSALAR